MDYVYIFGTVYNALLLKTATRAKWGWIWHKNPVWHRFWNLWAYTNKIGQKKILDFFFQFHLTTMPICSVFDAFWHVWDKYLILPWVAEVATGLFSNFNLWEKCSRGQILRLSAVYRELWLWSYMGGSFLLHTGALFSKSNNFAPTLKLVFENFLLKIRPSNFRYHLTRYTRAL